MPGQADNIIKKRGDTLGIRIKSPSFQPQADLGGLSTRTASLEAAPRGVPIAGTLGGSEICFYDGIKL
ncbi:MAG: hypothetical protein A2293_14140 [Elusimicrobia bacterium RIFOXYB2_FULL_49_7]|nr:MAG: hypothetical protein A2293_14140 [Elusimicrobia bacterium RIFOXYB2_FULL_49_7]